MSRLSPEKPNTISSISYQLPCMAHSSCSQILVKGKENREEGRKARRQEEKKEGAE